jgi:hypothetical protein
MWMAMQILHPELVLCCKYLLLHDLTNAVGLMSAWTGAVGAELTLSLLTWPLGGTACLVLAA